MYLLPVVSFSDFRVAAGAAAKAGHQYKMGKWKRLVDEMPRLVDGFEFRPLAAESSGVLHHTARKLFGELVGEVQARNRRRRGAGVIMKPVQATAAYWRAALTVSLLSWTVESLLSWTDGQLEAVT